MTSFIDINHFENIQYESKDKLAEIIDNLLNDINDDIKEFDNKKDEFIKLFYETNPYIWIIKYNIKNYYFSSYDNAKKIKRDDQEIIQTESTKIDRINIFSIDSLNKYDDCIYSKSPLNTLADSMMCIYTQYKNKIDLFNDLFMINHQHIWYVRSDGEHNTVYNTWNNIKYGPFSSYNNASNFIDFKKHIRYGQSFEHTKKDRMIIIQDDSIGKTDLINVNYIITKSINLIERHTEIFDQLNKYVIANK